MLVWLISAVPDPALDAYWSTVLWIGGVRGRDQPTPVAA
jgi:hypothetical protein